MSRYGLEVLSRYSLICSIVKLESALMVRIDDLKLPLHILRVMVQNGSEETVRELRHKHKLYLEENCPNLVQEFVES